MPPLASVRAANAAVAAAGKRAVVVGGTSGIGRGIAERLAAANVSVTIVGRDETRGAEVLAALRAAGSGTHSFVRCDASLISSATSFARHYTAATGGAPLDILAVSSGIATVDGFTPTAEGLDQKLAVHYFARVAFMRALAPLLRASPDPRVLTVLSAGVHGVYPHWAEDLELREHYSLKNAADAAGLYNDAAVDAMSREAGNERILFVHAAPGAVRTRWGSDFPWYLRLPIRALASLPLLRSPADCAEYMVAPLLQPLPLPGHPALESAAAGGGAPACRGFLLMGADADPAKPTPVHEAARDGIWARTLEVLRRRGLE